MVTGVSQLMWIWRPQKKRVWPLVLKDMPLRSYFSLTVRNEGDFTGCGVVCVEVLGLGNSNCFGLDKLGSTWTNSDYL